MELRIFLNIDPKDIGVIGGGRRKPTGVIDVALIQSLVRRVKYPTWWRTTAIWLSTSAIIFRRRVLSSWPAGRKRATFSDYPRRWPAKMVIIRSSSCNATRSPSRRCACPGGGAGDRSPRPDSVDAVSTAATLGGIGPSLYASNLCSHRTGRVA